MEDLEIRGRTETTQNTALKGSGRIQRSVLETSDSRERSSAHDEKKLKECEKRDKYLDLAGELKKLWNMKLTIIPIVIGAFGSVTKVLLKGLEDLEVGGRVETIQTAALLKTDRILRRVLET